MSTLNPVWRERIWFGGAGLVALWVGLQVAIGGLVAPALVVGCAVVLGLYYLRAEALGKLILAGLLAGYLIGNRGFAQFLPIPNLPLLPGEAGLAALTVWLFVERAKSAHPINLWDGIGWCLFAWIVYGGGRMLFDARQFGMLAIRDFAMVYYATFYFLARMIVLREPKTAEFLLATMRISALIMAPLYLIHQLFPGLFLDYLTLRGIPLIFYKTDLVGLYAAIGSILHFMRFEQTGRWRSVVFSLLLVGTVLSTDNRAAMVALMVMVGWVTLAGRWRLLGGLGGAAILGAIVLLFVTHVRNDSWRETPLFEIYEAVISITDPTGVRSYSGEDTFSKGDNNLFRWVWWQLVVTETWEQSPVFGLGFGYDLAADFRREYYADAVKDFVTRSPHNIFITIFGRMGLVGLVPLVLAFGLMLRATWQAARRHDPSELTPWAAAWAILASATFGVVLEGPMGAVVFWILLGTASGYSASLARDSEFGRDTENDVNLSGAPGAAQENALRP